MAKRQSDVRVVALTGPEQDDQYLVNQVGAPVRGKRGALKIIEQHGAAGTRYIIVKVLAIVDVAEESQPTRVVREVPA